MDILAFQRAKAQHKKLTMVTCYDYAFASILAQTEIDCLLVGDSVAMVYHGHPSTVHATVEMMALHTAAVARGAGKKMVIADLPFLIDRQGIDKAMQAVQRLMQAGAHAVKLEGVDGQEPLIENLVAAGVPVMGHLGLTPQSINQLGGHKVQCRDDGGQARLTAQAKRLQASGCFGVVLECVPAHIAQSVTEQLVIPTIGIGAGVATDGQVLVLPDLLGLDPNFSPKLVKKYCQGFDVVSHAVNTYVQEVQQGIFPSAQHSYS